MDDGPPLLRFRLSILMFLLYAVPGAFLPLMTSWLQEELHFTPMEIGAICATQAIAALVATWVAGQVADRWARAERCLAVASLLSGLSLWVLADLTLPLPVFAASLAVWLMLVPVATLGTSLCFTHLANPHHFGPVRLWGTVGWMVSGWLLGYWFHDPAWLCSLLRPRSEQSDIFRLASVLAFVLAVYAWTLPCTPPARHGSSWLAPLGAVRLLRQRAFAVYAFCTLGVTTTLPFTTQVTPLLLESLGVPLPWLGPTLTLSQSSEVIALGLLPLLLLRLGMRSTMRLGLGAWLLALTVLTLGQPTWLVVASLALNGLCICGYLVAGQVFVNSRARGDIRASVQGLLTFINGFGLLIGNLLVGVVRQEMNQAFRPTFGVAMALTSVLFLFFLIRFPPDETLEPLEKLPDS